LKIFNFCNLCFLFQRSIYHGLGLLNHICRLQGRSAVRVEGDEQVHAPDDEISLRFENAPVTAMAVSALAEFGAL
jgi:hypothetical protein